MIVNWFEILDEAMKARPNVELPRNFKLPSVPQSVLEFTLISNDPKAGPKQLAAPIESDSALTTNLLRQVNSTAVGLRQTVLSVSHAISLLGPRRTKTMVLTSALQSATGNVSSRLINTIQLQKENRIRAAYARRVAQVIGIDSELAYLAGLLQDFLLPILTEAFHADYSKILEEGDDLVKREQQRFGWNHAQIGAGVMYDWGFPDELVVCVLLHHAARRVVSDAVLRESSVGTAVAAASLPDSLGQSQSGFDTLLVLQTELPAFSFLDVAADVDEELNGGDVLPGQANGLCDRLAKLTEANLEQRRLDSLRQYRQLGSYMLDFQIGQGAMGIIYLARHCLLKRAAAIKVLNSAKLSQSLLSKFETEVQLTCQLTSPHTVAVYDYGVTPDGLFYYVMEYLDGMTLAELVREGGPLSAGRTIHFLMQVCASLGEAHSFGLIHRDLKPENLMVCCRGNIQDTIKVLDFGLATVMSANQELNQAGAGISGTPHYMSPEAITSPQTIDGRSDLYSLGAVAYFLLTGQTVFPATNVKGVLKSQLFEIPERPSARLGRHIDRDLEDLVLQCLAKSREDRPASPDAFRRKLSQCRSAGSWDPENASEQVSRPGEDPSRVAIISTEHDSLSATYIAHVV